MYLLFDLHASIIIIVLCPIAALQIPKDNTRIIENACMARGHVEQVLDTSFKGTTIIFQGHCLNSKIRIKTKVFLSNHIQPDTETPILLELRPPPLKKRYGRGFMYGKLISHRSAKTFFSRFRNMMQISIYKHLSPGSAAFISAVVLGNRRAVPHRQRMEFARLGLAHLLALSGLHTTIAAFIISYLILLFISRPIWIIRPQSDLLRLRIIISLAAALMVSTIGLNHPSSRRAAIFACFALVFYLVRRRPALLNILLISAVASITIFPMDLLSWSFAFSYLAVLGLAIFAQRGRHWWSASFYATLGASVFTAPMAFFIFRIPCPAAPIANLIFLPLFVPILGISLSFTFLSPFLPSAVLHIMAIPIDFCISAFLWLISFADHLLRPIATTPIAAISYFVQLVILAINCRLKGCAHDKTRSIESSGNFMDLNRTPASFSRRADADAIGYSDR